MLDFTFLSPAVTLSELASHRLISIGYSLPSLLATATGELEGEAYAKALGLALTIIAIVLYLSAQLLGELSVRIGLPVVLGELIAGLVIGLSGLHVIVLGGDAEVAGWMTMLVQSLTGQGCFMLGRVKHP